MKMVTTGRQSHAARVRVHAGAAEPAAPARRIIVDHHRTPRVEWSIDAVTGGHVLHLALAQCVFNNVLRIARNRELSLTDVSVTADGDFDAEGTASTGIECSIELSGDAEQSELVGLAEAAFGESTVVAVLLRSATVELTPVRATGR
jgi:putative redox protein